MAFARRNWVKPPKASVSTVCLRAEIWTQDLPNTKQECQPVDRNVQSYVTISSLFCIIQISPFVQWTFSCNKASGNSLNEKEESCVKRSSAIKNVPKFKVTGWVRG
jgi:hypothetical protein